MRRSSTAGRGCKGRIRPEVPPYAARSVAQRRRIGVTALVAGPAVGVWHNVVGRPGGAHSRGQGSLRGYRAGSARPLGRQGLHPRWGQHRPQAGVGGMGVGVPAILDGLCRRRGRGPKGQARDVAGQLSQTLGVARIFAAAGHADTLQDRPDRRPQAVSGRSWQSPLVTGVEKWCSGCRSRRPAPGRSRRCKAGHRRGAASRGSRGPCWAGRRG